MENIILVISLLEIKGIEIILLGDINLHYLRWEGIYIAVKWQAECLLKAIDT